MYILVLYFIFIFPDFFFVFVCLAVYFSQSQTRMEEKSVLTQLSSQNRSGSSTPKCKSLSFLLNFNVKTCSINAIPLPLKITESAKGK